MPTLELSRRLLGFVYAFILGLTSGNTSYQLSPRWTGLRHFYFSVKGQGIL